MKKHFLTVLLISMSLSCTAQAQKTFSEQQIHDCGVAQLKANDCVKEGKKATSGLFGSLAAKVTTSDMGKTAADKGAGQAGNLLCSKDLDDANLKCLAN